MRRKRTDSLTSWSLGSTDSSTAVGTTSTSDGSNNDAVYVFKNEMLSSSPQTSDLTMSSDCDDSDSSSSSDDHISISTVSFVRQNSICSCTQVGSARSISHSADCQRSLFFSNFCLHNSVDVDLEEKEDSSSLPGDCNTTTWSKKDSLALLGQGRVRI